MTSKPKAFDVEKALSDLEGLVEALEEGKLSLEESLERYERGVALARSCEQALQQAEQKVQALQAPSVDAKLAPLGSPETSGEE